MVRATTPLVALFVNLGLPALALAADADPFDVTGSLAHGNGTLQAESPHLRADGFAVGLYSSIAEDLVVFQTRTGRRLPMLATAFNTTVYGGYTLEDRVRFDLFVPIYPFADAPWNDWQGPAFGDIRVQGVIPIVRPSDAFGFAVVPSIGIPTGTKKAFLAHGFTFGARTALGGDLDNGFGWVANLGVTLSPSDDLQGVTMGSTFDAVGGVWYHLTEDLRIGAEADLALGLVSGDGDSNNRATAHVFSQMTSPTGVGMAVGAGTSLWAGVGAPEYRVFAAVTYGPIQRDKDKDGIVDKDDACPEVPEDFDEFEDLDGCPEDDNDQDTILDDVDECDNDPEDFDEWEDVDGCPDPDNDSDTLLDADDRCPIEAGPVDLQGCPDRDGDAIADLDDGCPDEAGLLKFEGCPDTDSDEVPDYRDACPDDPKPIEEDPETSDGCPKRVYLGGGMIKISERVLFKTGSAVILPASFNLLDEVVRVFKSNPQVKKVEVAGHTDDVGPDAYNMRLSQKRSESVRKYLVDKGGLNAERLTAKGYGETDPIDSNRTELGRQNNRRVEFRITEQEEKKIPAMRSGDETTPLVPGPDPTTPGPAAVEPGPTPGATTPPTDVTPTPPGPGTAAPAPAPGKLRVKLEGADSASVYVDGELLTRTAPFDDVELPAGKHTIRVVNRAAGIEDTWDVDVASGGVATIVSGAGPAPTAEPGTPEEGPEVGPWGTELPPGPPIDVVVPEPDPVELDPKAAAKEARRIEKERLKAEKERLKADKKAAKAAAKAAATDETAPADEATPIDEASGEGEPTDAPPPAEEPPAPDPDDPWGTGGGDEPPPDPWGDPG